METLVKRERLTVAENENAVFIERELADRLEIDVKAGARVKHYRLHGGADNALTVRIGENAAYELVTLHLGNGDLSMSFDLAGEGANCRSDVVYILSGDEKSVIASDVRHNADKTVSAQLVKGAVGGRGHAAFQGGILIPYDKKEIDGAQQHRALLLSRDATVEAVPRLEIYADDVKCAHGSAIGTLNQDQLYYMRTRGIDETDARALLTTAFLNEVLDGIEDESVRAEFERLADEGLKK